MANKAIFKSYPGKLLPGMNARNQEGAPFCGGRGRMFEPSRFR
jgi:hypothetical protein